MQESDWSMVIKLHAIFEAVLSNLITKRLEKPQIGEVISNLEFNNKKSGKVALAKALNLIEARDVTFLRDLSELRNLLVHNIENVTFSFVDHVAKLSPEKLKKFRTAFGYAILGLENGERDYTELVKTNPKLIVHLAAWDCLLNLQYRIASDSRSLLLERQHNALWQLGKK
jgi:hypothetical protein